MLTPEQQRLRARVAALSQTRDASDPELVAARTELAALNRQHRARTALAQLSASERAAILQGYGDQSRRRR